MKMSCNIVEDLLPLYADGICSEDSRAALEEHLKECPSCRAALDRMQSGITDGIEAEESAPKLAGYARKVRNHRIRTAVLVVFVTLVSSVLLALVHLTLRDMRAQSSPAVHEVELGTWNLTASGLETTAEEIGPYIFFTNSTRITVTAQSDDSFEGAIMLWNTENSSSFIQISEVSGTAAECTFTGLSAANRYRITCDGLDGAKITVSEGRIVSFWHSLGTVLRDIVGMTGR